MEGPSPVRRLDVLAGRDDLDIDRLVRHRWGERDDDLTGEIAQHAADFSALDGGSHALLWLEHRYPDADMKLLRAAHHREIDRVRARPFVRRSGMTSLSTRSYQIRMANGSRLSR